MRIRQLIGMLALVFTVTQLSAQTILPEWEEGTLDIHFISTGRGNCSYMVMPDGTTMLIDAGEEDPTSIRVNSDRNTLLYPDTSKKAYEWQADYIRAISPAKQKVVVDYAFITHFHGDHIGSVYDSAPRSAQGNYLLTGISGLGELLPIRTIVDRGWNYPVDMKKIVGESEQLTDFANYAFFIEGMQQQKDLQYEVFEPGRDNQFRMLYQSDKYPSFHIRNIQANGQVKGTNGLKTLMPSVTEYAQMKGDRPSENHLSAGILIQYGLFKCYMGGDIPGTAPVYEEVSDWSDVESFVAPYIGEVDVTTTNHHANRSSMTPYYLSVLKPRVIIQEVWSSDHPGHEALLRMTSQKIWEGERDLFATNMLEANKLVIGELIEQSYRSTKGHLVVRVEKGGACYWVYNLNHESTDRYVTGVYGPYQTKTGKTSSLPYRLVAHRGGIVEGRYDEFDPRSIQAAVDSGYWMLEMDVRPTKDKQIVLHHDETLKRIYGLDKRPEDMTLKELKSLQAINGGYAPMTLEEACKMCTGKVRFMVDVKPDMPETWFYKELKRILRKYDMLASAYYIRNDVQPYFQEGKFGFRITEIPTMNERIRHGEDISRRYYLFDHGNRLNAESVKWAQENNVEVCASVNFGHYKSESYETGVLRDIQHLRALGVVIYQIDSDFDKWLR